MAHFVLEAVPHFVTKSAEALEEKKQELLQEYGDFLRFLLTSQDCLTMKFQSCPGATPGSVSRVEVSYEIAEDNDELEGYLRSLRRYLRLRRVHTERNASQRYSTKLRRRVHLVGVGSLDKLQDSDLKLIDLNAKQFMKFDPTVMGGSVGSMLVTPLTHFLKSQVTDIMPDVSYLVPISQPLVVSEANFRWRNTLQVLQQSPGGLTITCRRYTCSDADVKLANLSLLYYVGTHSTSLSQKEIEENTSVLKSVFAKEPVYTLDFGFCGEGKLLAQALMRDTDPKAFENTPTRLENKVLDSQFSFEPSRLTIPDVYVSRSTVARGSDQKSDIIAPARRTGTDAQDSGNPLGRYAEYFLLDEAVDLLLPPYTFRDALPGVVHYVPKPFQEPALAEISPDRSITLGTTDTGSEIRLSLKSLTRHTFITGASGAGKSNTMMNIVRQLHEKAVPVLIIDPVKRDFEPLMRSMGLESRVFDFGIQGGWLRFNPFIPADNITLYSHSVILAKTFSMLFPTNAVAGEILLGMVKETYLRKMNAYRPKDKPLTTEHFVQKTGRDLRAFPKMAPTFQEFLEIGMNVLREGATGASRSQFAQEAIEHFERRWAGLRRSVFSLMLSPKAPYRVIDDLFQKTSLLEFTAWFDQNEANAAFALIFSMMFEQRLSDFQEHVRENERTGRNEQLPIYLAVLDEAHRIVPAQQGGGDDRLVSASKEAAALLSQMIAECRALGQGLIVAEQSASKIDPNVLINTSTKIVHTVFYGKDKEFLSSALSLSPAEQDYLAYLRIGEALAFTVENYQPVCVNVPEYRTENLDMVGALPSTENGGPGMTGSESFSGDLASGK